MVYDILPRDVSNAGFPPIQEKLVMPAGVNWGGESRYSL